MRERQRFSFNVFTAIIILFAVRILWAIYLWIKAKGFFVLLEGPDWVRVLEGYGALNGFHNISCFIKPPTPLAPWIYSLGFRFYSNPFFIPSLINTIFGLGAILALFFLSRTISDNKSFKSNMVGLLSVGMAIFYPVFIWASLSGDRHAIFLFFILIGLLCWVNYIKKGSRVFLILASIFFMLSTATMHQGWIYTFVFVILILKDLIGIYKKFKRIDFFLISCILIASSCIFLDFYCNYKLYGSMFHYLKGEYISSPRFTPLAAIIYFSLFTKMLIYPLLQLFWPRIEITDYPWGIEKTMPIVFITIFVIVMVLCRRKGKVIFNYALFLLLWLSAFSILAMSGDRQPIEPLPRYRFTDIFPFFPVLSLSLYLLIAKIVRQKKYILLCIIMGIVTFSSINILSSLKIQTRHIRKEAIQLGIILKSLWEQDLMGAQDKILIERFCDRTLPYLVEPQALQLFKLDNIEYDREWRDVFNKKRQLILEIEGNPSVFDLPVESLNSFLRENGFRIVIIYSQNAKRKLYQIMEYAITIGEYNIYVFRGERQLSDYLKKSIKHLPTLWLGRIEGQGERQRYLIK